MIAIYQAIIFIYMLFIFRRVFLNNIKFYFKISWIKMGNVEDRMNINIDEANDDYCKSLGFITLKLEKFSEFAREGKDARKLSDPIYIRGFQWRILAKPMESRRRDAVGNRKSLKSLSYFLQCSSEKDSHSFSAKAKFKLLAQKEGKEDYVKEFKHSLWRNQRERGIEQFMGYEELMDPKNGWYDESTDSIILRAEINVDVPIGIIGQSQMCENLLDNLFDKRDRYCDCTLVSSDGIKFKAHKCILASQSPVFAAMFEHGMVEAQNGIVNIEDIQSNILEKMIRYMYTGQLNIENIAEDLLIAAEKYELVNLKLICQRNLVDSLNNENACRLLVLAGQNSSKFLKVNAIEYIKENGYEVRQTEGWKMLLKGNYGDLVDQIFKAVLPKKN